MSRGGGGPPGYCRGMAVGGKSRTGTFFGMSYHWRKPTMARFKDRMWNATEPRVSTPRASGGGYDVNAYRLFHRRAKSSG